MRDQNEIFHHQKIKNSQIWQKLIYLNLRPKFLDHTIKQYSKTGSIILQKKPGFYRTVHTQDAIKHVKYRIHKNPAKSVK